jgi:hypothetical protein
MCWHALLVRPNANMLLATDTPLRQVSDAFDHSPLRHTLVGAGLVLKLQDRTAAHRQRVSSVQAPGLVELSAPCAAAHS